MSVLAWCGMLSAARRFLTIVDLGSAHQARAADVDQCAVVSGIRPMSDWAQYGCDDYCDSLCEHWSGDCEDNAILKYTVLRALRYVADDLRITIVRDPSLRQILLS